MHFTALDWGIVIVYLAATLAAGLYGRRYISGLSDFLVAGRGLGPYIGIATLAATEIGTITFMYYAELGYKTGFASFVNGLIAGAAMIFIGRTGFLVSKLRELGLMTVPEFFERKYSRNLRVLTGVLVATGGILNMGVFLKVEGMFLTIISGLPMEYLKLTMTGILLLELIYTVLGGMVSIVITDFIQFAALTLGTILVTIYSIDVAGWGNMRDAVTRTMGADGFNPFTNPDYGWAYILFQILLWLAVDTCWQTTAMRTFSTKDPETSRRVFFWTGFIYLGRGMLPMIWGIAALAMLGPESEFARSHAAPAGADAAGGCSGPGGGRHACRHHVGEQFLPVGMERHYRAGHRGALAAQAAVADRRSAAAPRHQLLRQRVRAVLGRVVHAARPYVFLSEHYGHHLSGRDVFRGDRGALLEACQCLWRLLRDDCRRHRIGGILLLQSSGQLCGARLVFNGRARHGFGLLCGRFETQPCGGSKIK